MLLLWYTTNPINPKSANTNKTHPNTSTPEVPVLAAAGAAGSPSVLFSQFVPM